MFKTFRPKKLTVQKFVDYYYLDVKPHNILCEYQCFPHFNTTISIYKSHRRLENSEMEFDENATPYQIFTPVREKVLNVKQVGKVFRLVIVFRPLGIQHFYENLNFANYILDYPFFNRDEMDGIFATNNTDLLGDLVDEFLMKRFKPFSLNVLETAIEHVFNYYEDFSVERFSDEIGISRQHLNRLFNIHLGVSVKKFQEIVLFRLSVNKKLFENYNGNFAKLAYELNLSDQSHFNKMYKLLTHISPKNFFSKGTLLGSEDTFWHLGI